MTLSEQDAAILGLKMGHAEKLADWLDEYRKAKICCYVFWETPAGKWHSDGREAIQMAQCTYTLPSGTRCRLASAHDGHHQFHRPKLEIELHHALIYVDREGENTYLLHKDSPFPAVPRPERDVLIGLLRFAAERLAAQED